MATERKAEPREYIVLKLDQADPDTPSDRDRWAVLRTAMATDARDAIQQVISDDEEGTFVAIPGRSWKPQTRKVETVRKPSWS